MKKLVLLLIAVIAMFDAAKAQTSLVATLSHDGTVSTYYSANALKDAYEAAVDGDVVTLSSGSFAAPATIAKNITVRGAGMMLDRESTVISGVCKIDVIDLESANVVTLEGLHFSSELRLLATRNASIIKCRLQRLSHTPSNSDKVSNLRIIHSLIEDMYLSTDAMISNSYFPGGDYSTSVLTVSNCVIPTRRSIVLGGGTISNSVLYGSNYSDNIYGKGVVVKKCVYVGPADNFYKGSGVIAAENKSFEEGTPIFKEGTTTYELTDENKANWLGTDGTEVGLYGGNLPFDPTPSSPQITKFKVAPKTTADGKLSVDIEVKAN